MSRHVTVRMTVQASFSRPQQPREVQLAPAGQRMHVNPDSDPRNPGNK
jgi:hypothetical protein